VELFVLALGLVQPVFVLVDYVLLLLKHLRDGLLLIEAKLVDRLVGLKLEPCVLFPDRLKSLEVLASEVEALELPGVRNLLQVLFLVGVDLAQLFTAACSLIVSKLLL